MRRQLTFLHPNSYDNDAFLQLIDFFLSLSVPYDRADVSVCSPPWGDGELQAPNSAEFVKNLATDRRKANKASHSSHLSISPSCNKDSFFFFKTWWDKYPGRQIDIDRTTNNSSSLVGRNGMLSISARGRGGDQREEEGEEGRKEEEEAIWT